MISTVHKLSDFSSLSVFNYRFKPAKAAGGLSSLKAKRLRHKDVTLALLAPDIIESDPYVSKQYFCIVF